MRLLQRSKYTASLETGLIWSVIRNKIKVNTVHVNINLLRKEVYWRNAAKKQSYPGGKCLWSKYKSSRGYSKKQTQHSTKEKYGKDPDLLDEGKKVKTWIIPLN